MSGRRATELTTAQAADPRLYALAQHAQAELGAGNAAPAADRMLAKLYLETGRKAGAGLDSARRVQAVRLLQRHADLERDFSLALAADSTTIRIPLRDTVGLDPQFLSRLERKQDDAALAVARMEHDRRARAVGRVDLVKPPVLHDGSVTGAAKGYTCTRLDSPA